MAISAYAFTGCRVLSSFWSRKHYPPVAGAPPDVATKKGGKSKTPALDSFGPNMTLAKELLQEGERDVVLEFFELCSEFWKTGREGRLTEWSNAVKEGKIPDFGANLYY